MSAQPELAALLARRTEFKAFLTARLGGDEADAEDVLQAGLAKAFARAGDLRDDTRLVPWFYQLLRHALVDHLRSRHAARLRDQTWATEALASAEDPAARQTVCRCFESLLPLIKPVQAELLRRVEIGGEPVAAVARDLGLTANHASFQLHRARKELRLRLEAFCGDCSVGACLHCDCGENNP